MEVVHVTQADLHPQEILRSLGINGTPTITPVQGGFDMAMWKVEYEGQSYALRVFREGEHVRCERERVVMKTAREAGLPTPELHASGIWQDRPVLLITWLPGRMLTDEIRARPWHLWRLGIAFGRMQAAIHALPAPDLLCQQPRTWITWQCNDPILLDRLRHQPCSDGALLHLDYHPNNVLTDGKRITGIVDWANTHAGDPRADAARTVSILRVDPHVRKPLLLWLGLRIFETAWRSGYQRAGGHLKDMSLFYAWAGVVMQRDLAHHYEHRPQELAPARRWTNKWKARAGLP
jgi:aminoglycoside phosphotransferase (APT) family kinase protein